MTTRSRTKGKGNRSLANEVLAVVLVAAAILLLLSLLTFDPTDQSWNSAGPQHVPNNLIGVLGAHVSDVFLQLFGLASVALPILLILTAIRMFFSDRAAMPLRKGAGAFLLLIALSGFLALFPKIPISLLTRHDNGGLVGTIVEGQLVGLLNTLGAAIVLGAATVLTLMLTMEVSLASALKWVRSRIPAIPVARKGVPPVLARLSAKWMEWIQQRRLLADERHAEKMERRTQDAAEREQRRLDEQERRERARELMTEEHRRRAEEERRRRETEAIHATA